MAKYRYVYTTFWNDPRVVEEMTAEDKYFFLYLLTNESTTQIGIYQITKKQIAFDMGYSMESAGALLQRFRDHHKIIKYNEETREIAIKNWGKYNLNRGGKPILDCVKSELKEVKDTSLIRWVGEGISNDSVRIVYESYYVTLENEEPSNNAGFYDTSTIRGQKEKEEEKENKKEKELNNKNTSRKRVYDESSVEYQLAKKLYKKILTNDANFKQPNMDNWADSIRLMMERDKRTVEQIEYLIDWSQNNSFWQSNILSTKKLREKATTLILQIKADKEREKTRENAPQYRQVPQGPVPEWFKNRNDTIPVDVPESTSTMDFEAERQKILEMLGKG